MGYITYKICMIWHQIELSRSTSGPNAEDTIADNQVAKNSKPIHTQFKKYSIPCNW